MKKPAHSSRTMSHGFWDSFRKYESCEPFIKYDYGAALSVLRLIVGCCGPWFIAIASAAEEHHPITPSEVIILFNGKDLNHFTTWEPKYGKNDPDRVFTVVDHIDGAPAIRISGQHFGGIVTKLTYANYRLLAEFRWGNVTWKPRDIRARDSGILLHCRGEVGNASKNFNSPWMRSVEFQIIEGGTGDIILIGGYDRGSTEPVYPKLTATVILGPTRWDPNGSPMEIDRGRINWLRRDPEWKDAIGFRGRADAEKVSGEWNRVEAICDGDRLIYLVNGEKVMEAQNCTLKDGNILFQSEGAEIYFRKIELHPLSNR